MDYKFEETFNTDEELEREIELLVKNIGEEIEKEESGVKLANIQKIRQLQLTYSALKYLTKGSGVTVSYKLNEPFKTMGSVSAEGKLIEILNPKLFSQIASLASNTEVYPLAKNKVRLTFTFHGLAIPISE